MWLSLLAVMGSLTNTASRAQSVIQTWEGIAGPTGSVPPDPHGAPGPEGVLATVNLQVSYYTKSGTLVWGPANLSTFFVGNTGGGNSDPKAVFDHASRRFFVVMQENTASRFWLNVAVSRSSDPRSSTAADWITYRFDATEYTATNTAGGKNYGGDYPGMAVDSQALYVAYRMFAFNAAGDMSGCGCDVLNTALLIMNKSQLINGNGTLASLYFEKAPDAQVVTPIGTNPGNVVYIARLWGSSTVKIYAVRDPLGARTVSSQLVSVTDRGGGPTNGAPQYRSTNTIDTINGKTLGNASLVGGDVWFCGTRGQSAGPAVAVYYRLRLNGWPASGSVSVAEEGTVGDSSYWNFCPALGLNQAGDAVMTWTRSWEFTYPTMMCATRSAGASAFGPPFVVKASDGPNNDGRWGDYFSVWPDPNDGSLWAVSEWTRSNTGTWSTWWAQIQTPARDSYVNKNAPFPSTQDGSLVFPYTTIGAGHAAITRGTLHIYGGHYNEQITLNKAVTLEAYSGGPVTIGIP